MQQQHSSPGCAAIAPPPPPPPGSTSPSTTTNATSDGGAAGGVPSSSPLPFSSLPGWPQTHLLHHLQQQQGSSVDNHVYLQHALHLAQRAMQSSSNSSGNKQPQAQQQAPAGVAGNNLKLQDYLQLQSAMSGMNPSDRERVYQLSKHQQQVMQTNQQQQQLQSFQNQQQHQQQQQNQQQHQQQQHQQQQQQRVPNNMAFLFGGGGGGGGSHVVQQQQQHLLPRSMQQQQYMPEMIPQLQARMMAMHKAAADSSPHLRLGTPDASTNSSGVTAAPVNGLPVVHANGETMRPSFVFSQSPELRPPQVNSNVLSSLSSKPSPDMQQRQHFHQQVSAGLTTASTGHFAVSAAVPVPSVASAATAPGGAGGSTAELPSKSYGFTLQQLKVLRAQILAFRRLKRGERFSVDMIRVITPPPLPTLNHAAQVPPAVPAAAVAPTAVTSTDAAQPTQESGVAEEQQRELSMKTQTQEDELSRPAGTDQQKPPSDGLRNPGQETAPPATTAAAAALVGVPNSEEEKKTESSELSSLDPSNQSVNGSLYARKSPASRRYRGPLFDFPPLGKPTETFLTTPSAWGQPLNLGYDASELLMQEGERIISKKKLKKLKVVEMMLLNDLPSELKLKLRIEQKKMILLEMQGKIRNEIEEEQQEIMSMGDRAYRKFVRLCERQRLELARQVMAFHKTTKEKYLKAVILWRKKLLEAHWATRDARINRNRGVSKFHDRLLREFSKRKDEDRSKRMEALKNNDVDAYREMLIKQQKEIPGDAKQRFEVLSSFLTQTEDYLHKLGGKISAVKEQQEKEEAALAAAASAKAQGLSEEEIERAALQASDLVSSKSWKYSDHPNKYYNLAHAVSEQILRQPSMLRAGILRDYQLVGLQWMLSLYNNRLNGILADEMGLGKTVQVMALIAYLMEFKGNYGPHLIIVPNAVIVNWKSELLRWLPSVSCIFYVGVREERSRIYSQEVAALKFNVLVTTYEFIMRDRSKLAKVDWKYIIIDEAQRMKDRESRLARDLDRFRCQRRLLLTGTPLQNDLHELWSLLNLLLPEVFDNSKAFHDWFSKPFQKEAQSLEDDWLETEKKVIVIHRLHQILEPFMLRRRVEDVEGSLPPKVAVVLKCKMSYHQAAIYDWVKATGTIRLDPAEEELRLAGGTKRQIRAYAPLQNKCMELRKVCNHPYLNYPPRCRVFNENVVRMCGKLWILDRILIKLQRSGHRVLLFSTMTKLLDILEDYLQWRGLIYRRIDGTTPLDSRESAIVDFNSPGSQCFIFLLSIRAAGRGLNLQTADTVVIYDPDPNPKNEEQAVARAHRIGQKSEVKVIYLEAVVETVPCYHKEDEIRNGGSLDTDDDMAGKDRYMGSVESLVRNNIQQHKIDMADEVINAGRFDQRTTHEERRMTLEALLHDEERYQESVHDVPTLKEVNRMISRSDEEIELFDKMDEDCKWPGDMIGYDEVPEWLHVGTDEVTGAIKATSKQSMMRGISGISGIVGTKAEEEKLLAKKRKGYALVRKSLKPPAKRGRPPLTRVVEAEEPEDLEEDVAADEESTSGDEEGEIREASEDDDEVEMKNGRKRRRQDSDDEDAGSSEDREEESPETQTEVRLSEYKKFGSLAELGSRSQQEGEDLEEGEIIASGGSHPDSPPSENWVQEEEEDRIATPRKKRKRSTRPRRRIMGNVPVQEAYPVGYLPPSAAWPGFNGVVHPDLWSVRPAGPLPVPVPVPVPVGVPGPGFLHAGFTGWNPPTGMKQNRVIEPVVEETRAARSSAPRMQENVQKKCKAVLSKLQGAMNREGRQVSALLMELPRHNEFPDYYKIIAKPIDAKTIEEHLEHFDYATVLDFAADVQLMLDNASRYNSSNAEVQADARRLHSLFFQRMGLMFPDVNFNTIKTNIGMPALPSGARSTRKQRQVFPEVGRLSQDDPPPPPPRENRVKERVGKKEKESTKLKVVLKGSERRSAAGSSSSGRTDRGQHFHPAELVISKQKRSVRRRLRTKAVVANKRKRGAQAAAGTILGPAGRKARSLLEAGGPLSWARARSIAAALSTSVSEVALENHSYGSYGSRGDAAAAAGGGGGLVPRKKSRTDTGRRRPVGRP